MQVIDMMWHEGPGFLSIAGGVFMFFIGMIIFAVFVTVSFFLIRFLLAATTAAQLYVAKNSPVQATRTPTTPAAHASGSAVEEPTPKGAESMSAAKTSTSATISSPVTPVKAAPSTVTPAKVTPVTAPPAKVTPPTAPPVKVSPVSVSPVRVTPAKATPAKMSAKPAAKAAATPVAAAKAPVKPAASVPRTPKSPKSPTPRSAPKKP